MKDDSLFDSSGANGPDDLDKELGAQENGADSDGQDELEKLEEQYFDYESEIEAIEQEERAYQEQKKQKMENASKTSQTPPEETPDGDTVSGDTREAGAKASFSPKAGDITIEDLDEISRQLEKEQDDTVPEDRASAPDDTQIEETAGAQSYVRLTRQERKALKDRREEAEWLGEEFDGNPEKVDGPKKKKKKKKRGLAVLIAVLICAVAGGAFYYYKQKKDNQEIADFSSMVSTFQSEKLDGVDFGIHQEYFTDFMDKCQTAIEEKDLNTVRDLKDQWADMENEYETVSEGKVKLDAFADALDETLLQYIVTDEYTEQVNTLKSDTASAKEDVDYEKLDELQEREDALLVNLKSASLAQLATQKNDIENVQIDDSMLSDEQKTQIQNYSDTYDSQVSEGKYADAQTTLSTWSTYVTTISQEQESEIESERARAESESAQQSADQAAAQSEAESRAAESYYQQQSEQNSGSGKTVSSSSGSSDYVIPGSDSRYLTASDLSGLSSYELMLARNEIYARHGRKFANSELQAYFNSKSWYNGTIDPEDFSPSVFNQYEVANIALIQSYE